MRELVRGSGSTSLRRSEGRKTQNRSHMSRSEADGSRLFCGSPRLDYGTIQRANGGNPGDRIPLTKEEEEEAHRQGEQVIRGMKQLGCTMVLLPAIIITR